MCPLRCDPGFGGAEAANASRANYMVRKAAEPRLAMSVPIRPRRSVLFMPGSNPRALEKARALPCDGLIFDLEDAVAPEAKETARTAGAGALGARGRPPREVIFRGQPPVPGWG